MRLQQPLRVCRSTGPSTVVGYRSPYPTVVIVTTAHQTPSQTEPNSPLAKVANLAGSERVSGDRRRVLAGALTTELVHRLGPDKDLAGDQAPMAPRLQLLER